MREFVAAHLTQRHRANWSRSDRDGAWTRHGEGNPDSGSGFAGAHGSVRLMAIVSPRRLKARWLRMTNARKKNVEAVYRTRPNQNANAKHTKNSVEGQPNGLKMWSATATTRMNVMKVDREPPTGDAA